MHFAPDRIPARQSPVIWAAVGFWVVGLLTFWVLIGFYFFGLAFLLSLVAMLIGYQREGVILFVVIVCTACICAMFMGGFVVGALSGAGVQGLPQPSAPSASFSGGKKFD